MDRQELIQGCERLAMRHGPWQDNLLLGDGVYTVTEQVTPDQLRLKAILQAAADVLDIPVERARVLDLGAAEGAFALELARQGATVVALEGRVGNVEKIRFAKEALGLERLEVVQADVRELSRETYGEYDLVLCLGILYHMDGPSGARLARAIADVCRRVAVIDTHFAFKGSQSVTVDGYTYWGRLIREFDPDASEQEQERLSRSALGNPESLWFTLPSLLNLVADVGFTSAMAVWMPPHPKTSDRVTLLALKGSHRPIASESGTGAWGTHRLPERQRNAPHANQTWRGELKRRFAPMAPTQLKEWARRRRERSPR